MTQLELNKTFEYLSINETNGINYAINEEKIRKKFIGE